MKKLIILLFVLLLCGVCFSNPHSVVAHYKLNDNTDSNTILDNMSTHNGLFSDAAGDPNTDAHDVTGIGNVNTALDFDGTDDFIVVTDHADFTFALAPFSISAWVDMDSATNFVIASKGVLDTNGEWLFYCESNKYPALLVFDENTNDCYIGRKYGVAATADVWTHIVATYNGGTTSAGIKVYINGARMDNANLEASQGSFATMRNGNSAVHIGRCNTAYANGTIDNVIIFGKELSADNVKALYNGGHGTEIVADLDELRRIKRRLL